MDCSRGWWWESDGEGGNAQLLHYSQSPISSLESLSQNSLMELKRCVISVAFLKNEGIRYSHVKQKVKDVLVKLSAFCSAAIVPPDLVTCVDPTHKRVIVDDGRGTGNRYP